MSTTTPFDSDVPSPDTLAGIYLCVEGAEQVLVRPEQIYSKSVSDKANGDGEPTREQLAGVYVCIEGNETIPPLLPHSKQ